MKELKFGGYEYDSSNDAQIIINERKDKHYHYLVLDNTIKNTHNNKNDGKERKITFVSTSEENDIWGLPKLNEEVRPLAKYGNMRAAGSYLSPGGSGCRKPCSPNPDVSNEVKFQGPISWTYPINSKLGSSFCFGLSATGGYILSGSVRYKNSSDIYNNAGSLPLAYYTGCSSWNIDSSIAIESGGGDLINYTADETIYKKKKEYSLYGGDSHKMLKKENTPEFFACLPLIKI